MASKLFAKGMPLDGVDLGQLAVQTEGLSGADLDAWCDAAGVQALVRGSAGAPSVIQQDFVAALVDVRASKGAVKAKPGQEGYI